ncbi:sugar ABC transporter substrate-binding protein [Angustibacter sp. McL0619]|uniref:sugar ABC transporter substrate-binding protein n=1 Tax=Angustibacter sp. McL0619 TaxID=3415676 RepID=UPI003CF94603
MAAIGALGVALALTACGNSSDDASSSSSKTASKGKIGVILPDTKSSARWESSDRPALEKAFKDAGIPAIIDNAQGDKNRMQTIADQMITQGVTVLAIVNLDSDSGAAIQAKAKKAGIANIDYDRLTLGGSADYYVSFDNSKVGTLQGEGLQTCLGADKKANIVFLNGSPTDNNATLFAAGAHAVLDKNTNFTKVAEQPVPDWDNTKAGTIFEQMFTQQKGKIDGVLAANDGLGNAAIAILKKNHLAGKVPVTGQDATVQGLQNVLDGSQCMTVYKSAKEEVGALADLAIAITKGEKGTTTGTTRDDTGNRDVPSVLLDPKSITIDTVKDVVSDGGASAAEVCTGTYAELCTKHGVS